MKKISVFFVFLAAVFALFFAATPLAQAGGFGGSYSKPATSYCVPPMVIAGSGLNRSCVCPEPYIMLNGICQVKPTCTAPAVYDTLTHNCVCPAGMIKGPPTSVGSSLSCSCPSAAPYWCAQKSQCVMDSSYCYNQTCGSTKTKKSCSGGYYYETCTTCPGAATSCTTGICNVDCIYGIDPATGRCKTSSSSSGSSSGSSSSGSSSGSTANIAAVACTGSSYGSLVTVSGSVSTYIVQTVINAYLENGKVVPGSSTSPATYTVDQNAYDQLVCSGFQEALDNANAATNPKFYVKNNPGLDCQIAVYKGSTAAYSKKCHTNTVAGGN